MTDTSVLQERISDLCHQFKLPTVGAEATPRFTSAGHGEALPTFLEVLEQEAEDRRQRRIIRRRRESRLPAGKTWETFEHDRVPLTLRQQLDHLANGSFVERGVNVLAFDYPAPARPTPCAPWAIAWWKPDTPSSSPQPTVWCRNCWPPNATWPCPGNCASWTTSTSCSSTPWGRLFHLPQGAEESEVLFTLIAERYERRSLGITSNLVFSEWERIFANPMATAAAIDRVVHHSVILEFDVPSYRTGPAQQRSQPEEVNRQN